MSTLNISKFKLATFRAGTCGKAVPIVEKLQERMDTAFPLLNCLRTHYERHCEPFSGQNAQDYRISHITYNLEIFFFWGGAIPPEPAK